MTRRRKPILHVFVAALVVAVALVAGAVSRASAGGSVTTYSGSLADGATYKIEVPPGWNGTLVLYSHGYVVPGSANPAQDVGDPLTGAWLLSHGYALAGSSYATTGWAIQQAIPDQLATLDTFAAQVGTPTRTIAWGHSLGGMVTAGLVQDAPGRFSAALPMCGVVSGGVGTWNTALDSAFAIQQLIAPSLQVVHITSPFANLGAAEAALTAAQAIPQGRARIALSAALGDGPGWFTPTSPEPAPDDVASQEANQFLWETQVDGPFVFAFRAELEARAGGNPSWNTGVDYRKQLDHSVDAKEVRALYKAAGLDLNADLATLNAAPRISADSGAVAYLTQNIVFNGDLGGLPVLTMHTTGDGLVPNQNEQAYRSAVQDAHGQKLLQQVFVHRAGHCTFTPAETIAALEALVNRLDTGKWKTDPKALNDGAAALGPTDNVFSVGGSLLPTGPSFIPFHPKRFLREFDLAPH
jgi:pimeloyl-ACP methyl ester carboxylesterase